MVSLALFLAAFGPSSTRYGFPSGNSLTAPIDGLVVAVNVAAGEFVNSGAKAMQIADFGEPLFEVSLDELTVRARRCYARIYSCMFGKRVTLQ